ncbi:ribosomal RNA small subunit methyltransferase G [Cypionkella aquatica]|uniref:Ribosomal RNA small subunit methyltransferase G n=1 Tax=Cypionkella aquatica TaxID=1756042 RepID=A0AA37X0W6_9RHOB|nr:16S rRNA (guanine(527)-N(7))-methyltransferase RsmG [Cypionkella aquatica]GLS86255.1 ribosomal RNA small subunit methyltransferase G [Cypionkella aquatica]
MWREKAEVPSWLSVSRETLEKLFSYGDLVEKWNPAVNLISKSGVPDLWSRHILDSAQIMLQAPDAATTWCDLGSGGGFPGIVLAILANELQPKLSMTMVESDRRKSVFLSEALRHLGITAIIKTERIEALMPQNADVLTARALAPLPQLCSYAHRHLSPTGVALFPKGAATAQEITAARADWQFDSSEMQSLTEHNARIVAIRNLRHA